MTTAIVLLCLTCAFATFAIIERRRTNALRHSSMTDPLTGLASRALLANRLDQALARCRRLDTGVAVIEVDVDGFAVVNDRFGHAAGDRLLADVGQRLESCLRQEDTLARSGGDEFVALLEDVRDLDAAVTVARRVERALEAPFEIEDATFPLRVSIGLALSETGEDPASELLYKANLALRKAKEQGRARFRVFDAGTEQSTRDRQRLEADLRQAVDRDELRLHFQPEVDLEHNTVLGIEALVRWQHPSRGLQSPSSFIPLAEDIDLVEEIGSWVLHEACHATTRLRDDVAGAHDLSLNVNVSRRQLCDPGRLCRAVFSALDTSGLPADALVLEITETALVENLAVALDPLERLRANGIRIAMDDFGTGYSSLAALRHMPVDILKLDQGFVADIADPEDEAIVRAVTRLAAALGLVVTAEGIESADQQHLLAALGCQRGQGFHLSHPLPEQRLREVLVSWPQASDRVAATLRVV